MPGKRKRDGSKRLTRAQAKLASDYIKKFVKFDFNKGGGQFSEERKAEIVAKVNEFLREKGHGSGNPYTIRKLEDFIDNYLYRVRREMENRERKLLTGETSGAAAAGGRSGRGRGTSVAAAEAGGAARAPPPALPDNPAAASPSLPLPDERDLPLSPPPHDELYALLANVGSPHRDEEDLTTLPSPPTGDASFPSPHAARAAGSMKYKESRSRRRQSRRRQSRRRQRTQPRRRRQSKRRQRTQPRRRRQSRRR